MKKVGPQTIIRKVYSNNVAPTQTQQVKRVNSLLPSPQTTKIVTRKVAPVFQGQQNTSPYAQQNTTKCFVCDELAVGSLTASITEVATTTTQTKLPNKIAKVVGDSFMVIVAHDDVICRRCLGLFNQMDKIESELERVKNSIKSFLSKKYSISDDDQPPAKLQKLNSGLSSRQDDSTGTTYTRKIIVSGKETIESQLKNIYENTNNSTHNSTSASVTSPVQTPIKRQPIKLYKCVSCDFKTTDLNAFQPHYEVCKGSSTNSTASTPQQTTTSAFRCKICKKLFATITLLNRHTQDVHVRQQTQEKLEEKIESQQIGATTISQVYACTMCAYKTNDKTSYDDHLRKHIKLKPFKCRLCLMRFETREQATIHAKTHTPAYFKCGICELAFNKREHLMEHLNTHENAKTVNQQEVVAVAQPGQSTQKLLQDSINEALRVDDSADPKNSIQFHSCAICSVTFLNELLYTQHMKVHGHNAEVASEPVRKPQMVKYTKSSHSTNSTKEKHALTEDLESILNKMHSENSGQATNGTSSDNNVLITTQESSSGGITYNITIPQDDQTHEKPSIGIDMPNLDHEDSQEKSDAEHQLPVSMPSLDEDEQQSQTSQEEHQDGDQAIPMELDDLQNAADGQQIKFILDENGQILQLDNHILTTDADGNQILVQGSDGEHLQQLLQSVGMVMQGGDGEGLEDGEHPTLQMMDDGSGQPQMILVQGADGEEPRLIDASMLQHEGGNLVLQQNENGETYLTTADGTPVSVSSSMEPGMGGEGQITVMAGGEGQQYVLQQMGQEGESEEQMELQSQESQGDEQEKHDESQDSQDGSQIMSQGEEEVPHAANESHESQDKPEEKVEEVQNESAENTTTTATGDGFFNLGDEQDIMQPAEEVQEQKEEQ